MVDYIVLAICALAAIGVGIYWLVKILRMPNSNKKELLITWLMGAVAKAEAAFVERGRGVEKLAQVEKYFNEHAPVFYKMVLISLGKNNLKELIEAALAELKEISFE